MEHINQYLFNFIYGLSNRNFFLDDFGIFCAQGILYLLIILFFIFLFQKNGRREKIFLFLETSIALIISRGIIAEYFYFFYHHLRPYALMNFIPLIGGSGYSFPSGHATFLFTLSMTVFLYNKKWGIWFFVLSLINGFARVYVGVHWPFDIFGGILIGIIISFIVHLILNKSRKKIFISEVLD